jgi:hypothetical protein
MERLARDKRSCLLRKYVTYGRGKFYNIGPRFVIYSVLFYFASKLSLILIRTHLAGKASWKNDLNIAPGLGQMILNFLLP